jgi:MA3 domain
MVIECCSQERSYSNFYGLVSERFCKLNRVWNECYERAFETYFETIHRYETNRLRNIARLFGHLIANDAMSWAVLQVIKMNEDDTTSSSRIFVKIMMQEVTESMGLPTLKQRFADPEIKALCTGMFPLDNPKNTRFAINYFTSIGLGAVTEEMREHLKVSQAFSVVYSIPVLICCFSRMHLALLWSNVARCWRPNPPLLTLHRIPIRPRILHRQIPTANPMRQMVLATAALPVARHHRPVMLGGTRRAADEMTVGHRLHRAALVGTRHAVGEMTVVHHHLHRVAPVGTRPAVGEMTVGHHLHHHAAFVGTRRAAHRSAMTAGRHRRRLALAGMMTAAVMVEIVVSPLRGIVDAATRFRGLLHLTLVGVTSGNVSVRRRRRHVERAHVTGTGTVVLVHLPVLVLVIMIAGEMIHGRGTGIADADADGLSLTFCVRFVYSP